MERMFQYYYRLRDRFGLPVSVFVIFTEEEAAKVQNVYKEECWETEMIFQFPTFRLDEYDPYEHDHLNNPMAEALKVAWFGLKKNKSIFKTDEGLLDLKIKLYRELLKKGYNKKLIRSLRAFIKNYISLDKPEFYDKFKRKIENIIKKEKNRVTNRL